MPQLIETVKPTVVNIHRDQKYSVYCGRRSQEPTTPRHEIPPADWGNPFSHLEGSFAVVRVATREESIRRHAEWVVTKPRVLARLLDLNGQTLGCFCKPKDCHVDTLAGLLDLPRVDAFTDDDRFYSNFWSAEVVLDGETYPTVEHAYQAAKTESVALRNQILGFSKYEAWRAKKFGKSIQLRTGWDKMRYDVMWDLVAQKFFRHKELGQKLLAGPALLFESNTWHDHYFGWCRICNKGENKLGEILMKVRMNLAGIEELKP